MPILMQEINSLTDLDNLRETSELECKLADGGLPKSLWETYSAFANSDGGVIVLGVREKKGAFSLAGVANPDKLKSDFFNTVNNPLKVSLNLLSNHHVEERIIDGKALLLIEVPRAQRTQRPIFLNGNPLNNTYRRQHEGDQKLSVEQVKRMLAEQMEDSRDNRVLPHYSLEDIELETLKAYRQTYANLNPSAPWNDLDNVSFLQKIGAWKVNRETGERGLTVAGLLMFGRHTEIQEIFQYYMLDYQERPEAKTERRWVDRVTLDGTWSGNVYDFYRRVYRKLISELKIPFELKEGLRQEDTPIHQALREALANVLVHADYSDRASVLVVKRPDMFGFRNPGLMRIPIEVALLGGEPDCRNRTLHQMFRYVNVGEQAGSGIPKILAGWRTQHWRAPLLRETSVPYEQTILELRMLDLFPEGVVEYLYAAYREAYSLRPHLEQVAMAVAMTEGQVNHARLCELTDEHPADITKCLRKLTTDEVFEVDGVGRGAVYHFSGMAAPRPDDVFGPVAVNPSGLSSNSPSSPVKEDSSPIKEESSPIKEESFPVKEDSSPISGQGQRDAEGRLLSDHLDKPIIDNLESLEKAFLGKLQEMANGPRNKQRVKREEMESAIKEVASDHFVTLACLADLLNRKPDTLRDNYLASMVKEQELDMAFPQQPTDPRQAYTATE